MARYPDFRGWSGPTTLTKPPTDGLNGRDGRDGEDGDNGALDELTVIEYSINANDPNADFATVQDFIDKMSDYPSIIGTRVEGVLHGFDEGGFVLWRDLSNVNIRAAQNRSALTYDDYENTFAPDWANDPRNDNANAKLNTLFNVCRTAIGSMLDTKYTSGIRFSKQALAALRLSGHKFGELSNLLITGDLNSGNGVETGNGPIHGEGAGIYLRACSVHGFGGSGISGLYGGSTRAWQFAHEDRTFYSCNAGDGQHFQYGATMYDDRSVCYANGKSGRRIKMDGFVYGAFGRSDYNLFAGISGSGGGKFLVGDGTANKNGGQGISIDGAAYVRALGNFETCDNGSDGTRVLNSGDVDLTGLISERNGANGLLATGNCGVVIKTSRIKNNVLNNIDARDGANIMAQNCELGNAGVLNARAEGMGTVIRLGSATIYGAPSAFGQVHAVQGGKIDIRLCVDDNGDALTHDDCTPDMNTPAPNGSFILGDLPSTGNTNDNTMIAPSGATAPALMNIGGTAAAPSILVTKSDPASGFYKRAGGYVSVSVNGVEALSINADNVIFNGVLRQGVFPGTRVLGPRRTGWTKPNGARVANRDLSLFNPALATPQENAEILVALIRDLHGSGGHGILGN